MPFFNNLNLLEMKQPSKQAKAQLSEILSGEKEIVAIKGTKHSVRIGTIKNGTLEKLTSLWSKRDMSKRPEGVNDTMAIAVDDIYFNHKEAAYIVLNSFWKIKLFHWIVWRWFAFVWQLDETQLSDILSVGKKKIPLLSYYENIVLTLYMAGVNQWICIALGVLSASVLVWATFHLNAKYGEWGLMKMQAVRNHPRYIINRKRFLRLIIPNLKNRKS